LETRRHPFFKALDWEQLEKKQVPPSMMPGMVEVSSMDCEFISCHIILRQKKQYYSKDNFIK
jgi:hypothetical protein